MQFIFFQNQIGNIEDYDIAKPIIVQYTDGSWLATDWADEIAGQRLDSIVRWGWLPTKEDDKTRNQINEYRAEEARFGNI